MGRTKTVEREIPQIRGGWSISTYDLLRAQRYTQEEIALAFGVDRRTIYNRVRKHRETFNNKKDGSPDRETAHSTLIPDGSGSADALTVPQGV